MLLFKGTSLSLAVPDFLLDLVRAPQTVEVKEILIADGEQRARMTFDIERDKFALSFNVALEQKTLNQILQDRRSRRARFRARIR